MASKFFDNFLDELEARSEIEDCLNRFARAVDRQDWALAKTLYHEGAFDDHGFFKGPPDPLLKTIAKLHTHQDHSMHFNTNVLIEFQARDKAFVETYVLVLQRYTAKAEGVAPGTQGKRVINSARYLDRFEKRNGEWRVVHRTLVFGDTDASPMELPMQFPPGFVEQKHGMDDVLYTLPRK